MFLQLYLGVGIVLAALVDASYLSRPMGRMSHRRQLMGKMGAGGGGGGGGNDGACKAYKILCARGTTEPQSGSIGYRALLKQVKAAVTNGDSREIVYSSSAEYMRSPTVGANEGLGWLGKQVAKCPKQLYTMIGYSKGAMVITQIVAKSNAPMDKVAAIAFFGNPYFKAGEKQNKCGAKTGKGIASMMMVKVPPKYIPITFDCCLPGDMICTGGGGMMAHLKYAGSSAEKETAQFMIQQLKAKLSGGAGGSGSAGGAGESGDGSGSSGGTVGKSSGSIGKIGGSGVSGLGKVGGSGAPGGAGAEKSGGQPPGRS